MFFLRGECINWLKPAALPRYLQYTTDGWIDITDSKNAELQRFTPSTVFYIPPCLVPDQQQSPAVAYDYTSSTLYRFTSIEHIELQELKLNPAEKATCCVFRGVEYVLLLLKNTTKMYALSPNQLPRYLDKATIYERIEYISFVACDSNMYLVSQTDKSIKLRGLAPVDSSNPMVHLKNISILMQPIEAQRESVTGLKAGVGLTAALKVFKIHYALPLFNRYIAIFYTPATNLLSSIEPKKAAQLPIRILLIDPVLMSADHVSQEGTVSKLDIMIHKFVSFQSYVLTHLSLDELKQRAHRLSVTIRRYDEFLETGAVSFSNDFYVHFNTQVNPSIPTANNELDLGVSSIQGSQKMHLKTLAEPDPETPINGSDSSLFRSTRKSVRADVRDSVDETSPTRDVIAPGAILESTLLHGSRSHASSPAVNNPPTLIDIPKKSILIQDLQKPHLMDATLHLTDVQNHSRLLSGVSKLSHAMSTSAPTNVSMPSPLQLLENSDPESIFPILRQLSNIIETQQEQSRLMDARLADLSQSLISSIETIKRLDLENGELRERVVYLEEVHNTNMKGPRTLTYNDLGQLKEEISIYAMTDIVSTFDRLADKVDSDTNGLKAKLSLMIEREINEKVSLAMRQDMTALEQRLEQEFDRVQEETKSSINGSLDLLRSEFITKETVSKLLSSIIETNENRLKDAINTFSSEMGGEIKGVKASMLNLSNELTNEISKTNSHGSELEKLRLNLLTFETEYNTSLPVHLEVYLRNILNGALTLEIPKLVQASFDHAIDDYVRSPSSLSNNPYIKSVEKRLNEEVLTIQADLKKEISELSRKSQRINKSASISNDDTLKQLLEKLEVHDESLLQLQIQVGAAAANAAAANNAASVASTLADSRTAIFKYVIQKLNEDYLPTFAADVTSIVIQRVKDDLESDRATADNRALIEEIVTSSRVINQIEALSTKTYVNLLDKVPGIVDNELKEKLPSAINEKIAQHLAEEVYSLKNVSFLDTLYLRIAERITQQGQLLETIISQVTTNILQELARISNIESPISPLAQFKVGLVSQMSEMIKSFMKEYISAKLRPSLIAEMETLVATVGNTRRIPNMLGSTRTSEFMERQEMNKTMDMNDTTMFLSKLQDLEKKVDCFVGTRREVTNSGISTEIIDEFSKVYMLIEKQKKDFKLIHQILKELQGRNETLTKVVEATENKTDKLHHILFNPRSVKGSNFETIQARLENVMLKQAKLEGEMRGDVKELKESIVYMDRYVDKLRVRFDSVERSMDDGVDMRPTIQTPGSGGPIDSLTVSQLRGSRLAQGGHQGIITTPLVDRLCLFLYAVARVLQMKMGPRYYGKTILECDKHDIREVLNVLERTIVEYVDPN